MKQENRERNQTLDLALTQIERQFGTGSIMRRGSKEIGERGPVISTGSRSVVSSAETVG